MRCSDERNVVPLFRARLHVPAGDRVARESWPACRSLNAVQVPADYFDEAMQKLRQRFLRAPVPATSPAATDTGSLLAESPLQPSRFRARPARNNEPRSFRWPRTVRASSSAGPGIPGAVDYVVERDGPIQLRRVDPWCTAGRAPNSGNPSRPAPWSYRVRAIGPGRTAGPWSAPAGRATDEVPPGQSGSGRPWTLQLGLAAMIVGALPLLYVGAVALLSPREPAHPIGRGHRLSPSCSPASGPGCWRGAAFTGRGWSRLPLAVLVGLLGLIVVATGSASSPATFWYGFSDLRRLGHGRDRTVPAAVAGVLPRPRGRSRVDRLGAMPLSDFPRYPLLFGPSPVHPLERLTAHLGGPRIWAKREDCNSRARVRRQQDPQAGVPGAGRAGPGRGHAGLDRRRAVQPHPAGGRGRRQARAEGPAGAGALGGLAGPGQRQGRQHPAVPDHGRRRAAGPGRVRHRVQGRAGSRRWRTCGAPAGCRTPIPAGASDHRLGGLGFAGWAEEVARQEAELGVFFDTIVVCSVTGCTQAGMIAGFAGQDRPRRVIGIDASAKLAETRAQVARIARATARADRAGPGAARRRDRRAAPAGPATATASRCASTIDAIRLTGAAGGDDHRPGLRGEVDGRADRPGRDRRDRPRLDRAVRAPGRPAGAQRLQRRSSAEAPPALVGAAPCSSAAQH